MIDFSKATEEFINNLEGITNIRKEFYKKIIKIRYKILEQTIKEKNNIKKNKRWIQRREYV